MAPPKKLGMIPWVPDLDSHSLVPAVGNRGQSSIEKGSETFDHVRKRISEVFVLPV